MRHAACVLLLLAAGVAGAAPPALTVTPANPGPGELVNVAGKGPLTFSVRGAAGVLVHPTKRSVAFYMPESGGVTVVASGTVPVGDLSDVAVVVVGGGGNPQPGPGPQPPPVDPVTPGKRFLVVVEETAEAAATRGALFADPTLAARIKDKGHRWRIVDKDVTGADGKPPADVVRFLEAAKGKAMPQVFVVDGAGKVLVQTELPTKAGDLVKLLEAWGG